jgi:hypothetical protein
VICVTIRDFSKVDIAEDESELVRKFRVRSVKIRREPISQLADVLIG